MKMAILIPLISVICTAVIGGVIGFIFILLFKTTGLHEWGSVILGMALVVLVPAAAFLLQNYYDKQTATQTD
jgi:NhaP-type Na+/H+ or K+/H+ antiporter|tara:strand:- start:1288 stop:1503 length:216 start_codon:yes stop_codon:yes gene_type:complete